jgi:predicted RND superfamily exporter protein
MNVRVGSLSALVIRRPRFWLSLFAALTLFFILGLRRLEIRTEGSAIYPKGSTVVAQSEKDRAVFRDPEEVILLFSSIPGGPPVDSPGGLRALRHLHRDLATKPWIEGAAVRSLASLPAPLEGGSRFSVQSLLASIP